VLSGRGPKPGSGGAIGQQHGYSVDDGIAPAAAVAAHGLPVQGEGLMAHRAREPLEFYLPEDGLESLMGHGNGNALPSSLRKAAKPRQEVRGIRRTACYHGDQDE
jgi:hypothetical protein